ncbi:unnamed protein product [Heterobilharzia americana]|nr:unnamed protein product [Heterobilharzia americana]
MVMVYQQSALAHTLQELHNTFAHCLPLPDSEQSSVLPLDIVRLAQLMKAFLRDLPVAVIPEEYYLDFCHLANITNTDEKILAVRKFLDNLPEIHRLCLIHIFNHLGFVVNHQNKLRSYLSNLSPINITQSNSLNAPSKLTLWLMVFRQILVRPPWHLITDIAMGMDTHMRALEAVFGVVVGSCVTDESENTSHIESSLSIPFVSEPNPDMNTSIARRKCDHFLNEWILLLEHSILNHFRSKISPQIETLNDEMNKAEQQIKTNKEEVSEQCKTLRIIFEKCANAVSQQRKLKRQAQEIRRALKDRGFNEESLSSSTSSLIDGSIPSVSSSVDTQNTSVPEEIRDRRYWFLTGVTREKVEALLADRPPGTFVIRPSTAGNKLALGVRLESSVQHCLIHCIEGKYGFVEKSCTYDSLEALVCYHHVHSLKRYNNLLNITLRYPFKLHLNT